MWCRTSSYHHPSVSWTSLLIYLHKRGKSILHIVRIVTFYQHVLNMCRITAVSHWPISLAVWTLWWRSGLTFFLHWSHSRKVICLPHRCCHLFHWDLLLPIINCSVINIWITLKPTVDTGRNQDQWPLTLLGLLGAPVAMDSSPNIQCLFRRKSTFFVSYFGIGLLWYNQVGLISVF